MAIRFAICATLRAGEYPGEPETKVQSVGTLEPDNFFPTGQIGAPSGKGHTR